MAMAMAMANLPLPLPLDSILASSWPWLALCVATVAALRAATVATVLRTISPSYFITKHAVSSSEAKLSTASACSSSDISSGNTVSSSAGSLIPRFSSRIIKSRKATDSAPSSDSSSSLTLTSSSGCISFEEDSLLNYRHSQDEASEPFMAGSHSARLGFRSGDIEQHFGFHPLDEFHQRHVSGLNENDDVVLGCIRERENVSGEDQASDSSVRNCIAQCLHTEVLRVLPSGVISLPCFERQRDLDTLLETKLGSPFICQTSPLFGLVKFGDKTPVFGGQEVVKAWPGHQKKLLEALGVEQSSAFSVDVHVKDGIACVGSTKGDLTVWDVGAMASSCAVSTDSEPVMVTSLNSERGLCVYANDCNIGFWDPKSNLHKNVGEWNKNSAVKTDDMIVLITCGDTLYISGDNEASSIYDLRKLPDGKCYLPQHMLSASPDTVHDLLLNDFWEKLAYDVEDDILDDYGTDYARSTSIVSRAVGLFEHSLHLYNRW